MCATPDHHFRTRWRARARALRLPPDPQRLELAASLRRPAVPGPAIPGSFGSSTSPGGQRASGDRVRLPRRHGCRRRALCRAPWSSGCRLPHPCRGRGCGREPCPRRRGGTTLRARAGAAGQLTRVVSPLDRPVSWWLHRRQFPHQAFPRRSKGVPSGPADTSRQAWPADLVRRHSAQTSSAPAQQQQRQQSPKNGAGRKSNVRLYSPNFRAFPISICPKRLSRPLSTFAARPARLRHAHAFYWTGGQVHTARG
jgi:hypothetical protein